MFFFFVYSSTRYQEDDFNQDVILTLAKKRDHVVNNTVIFSDPFCGGFCLQLYI